MVVRPPFMNILRQAELRLFLPVQIIVLDQPDWDSRSMTLVHPIHHSVMKAVEHHSPIHHRAW